MSYLGLLQIMIEGQRPGRECSHFTEIGELVRDGHREACGPSSVFRVLDPTRGRAVSRGQNESGTQRKGTRNPSREMINRVEMKA